MRIRIMSDLHTELYPFATPELADARAPRGKALQDVVVLAGDIGGAEGTIRWALHAFPDTPVVFVPGNHEYYNNHLEQTATRMKRAAAGTNVRILDNEELVIDGVRFLGSTLWTDFELFGSDENRILALAAAKRCMADFSCITYGSAGRFTPEQSVMLHREAVRWLEEKLHESFDGPTVVVTHHVPHWKSVHPRWVKDIVSAAFASDLERLMGFSKLWIHGHTHDCFDYQVRGTRVVCNPRGYRGENPEFNPRLVVKV
jgi:predicted phosphodiesterase